MQGVSLKLFLLWKTPAGCGKCFPTTDLPCVLLDPWLESLCNSPGHPHSTQKDLWGHRVHVFFYLHQPLLVALFDWNLTGSLPFRQLNWVSWNPNYPGLVPALILTSPSLCNNNLFRVLLAMGNIHQPDCYSFILETVPFTFNQLLHFFKCENIHRFSTCMKKNWRHLGMGDFSFSELVALNIIRKVCPAIICVKWEHFAVIRLVVKWPLSSSFSLFPSKALLTLHRLLNQNFSNNYILQLLCTRPQMTPK